MGRKAGRTPDATRRLLLDAAAAVVRERGVAATLDEVARRAHVSKGGLLYHFPTKTELLRALAVTLFDDFREAVAAAVDTDEPQPGRLTRAYLRASLAAAPDELTVREETALIVQLTSDPEIAALARADAEQWEAELRADGLPDDVLDLVVAAADGLASAPLWGASNKTPAAQRLQQQLVELTLDPERWSR